MPVEQSWRSITYDLPIETAVLLLGEPPFTLFRAEGRAAVMEWPCGCSACTTGVEACAMHWCAAHNDYFGAHKET